MKWKKMTSNIILSLLSSILITVAFLNEPQINNHLRKIQVFQYANVTHVMHRETFITGFVRYFDPTNRLRLDGSTDRYMIEILNRTQQDRFKYASYYDGKEQEITEIYYSELGYASDSMEKLSLAIQQACRQTLYASIFIATCAMGTSILLSKD